MRSLVALTLAVVLTGCVATTPVKLTAPFDAAQAQSLLAPGKNTITGSALMKRQDGIAVTCAGANVTLIPATAHASEIMQTIYGNTERGSARRQANIENRDPAYRTFVRQSVCNAQGFFTFKDVADGDFFVVTTVVWMAGGNQQGGALMQRVRVTGGQTQEVVLAP
jgi:hypothetical protein